MADARISGAREVLDALRQLEPRVSKKIIRQALRAAIRPMAAGAKDNAPRGDTGQLRRAINVRAGRRLKYVISIRLGVDSKNFESPGEPAAVEYGTAKQAAEPYMRPAFDVYGDSVKEEALRMIQDGIEREAAALKAN